mgnify:CR=1 FL=1
MRRKRHTIEIAGQDRGEECGACLCSWLASCSPGLREGGAVATPAVEFGIPAGRRFEGDPVVTISAVGGFHAMPPNTEWPQVVSKAPSPIQGLR